MPEFARFPEHLLDGGIHNRVFPLLTSAEAHAESVVPYEHAEAERRREVQTFDLDL